jgi:enoyl-CoA hydratase
MAFSSPVLTLEREGGVATVWLDRPEARNAMGPEFWADLPRAMEAVSGDDDVRAVVLAGRGPHFSVGIDLKAMGGVLASGAGTSGVARRTGFLRDVRRLQASITSVADCPKPVVAAVHGACLGGAIDLISACDVRLAAADAFFSIRETKIAIVADVGTLQRLPRIIGAGHVAELAYTGKDIGADRAREIGLVNDVLPDHDEVVAAALAMAGEIAANSPLAVQGTKAVLRAGAGRTVEEGLEYVALWNAAFLHSEDLQEALSAFVEKRPPTFKGQ